MNSDQRNSALSLRDINVDSEKWKSVETNGISSRKSVETNGIQQFYVK